MDTKKYTEGVLGAFDAANEKPKGPVDLMCPKCSTIHTIDVPCNKEGKERLRQNRVEGLRAASRIVAGGLSSGRIFHNHTDDSALTTKDATLCIAKTFAKYLEGEK